MHEPTFRVVPMHVARDPVARAVAITRMRQAVLDFQLRLHYLPEGQRVDGDVYAALQVLTVCLLSLEDLGRTEGPEFSVMRGAQSTLLQCASHGSTWRTSYAQAVDIGLQRAVDVFKLLPAEVTARAWQRMRRIEEDAGLRAGH